MIQAPQHPQTHIDNLTTLSLCSEMLLDNLTAEGQFHSWTLMEKNQDFNQVILHQISH